MTGSCCQSKYSSRAFVVSVAILLSASVDVASSFGNPVFPPPAAIKRTPSKREGVDIELPDFEELFDRIKEVSPLARMAIDRKEGGLAAVDNNGILDSQWKLIDKNPAKDVQQIDKIDNFQDLGCPIVRFRSSIQGPCIVDRFANFIMNLEERKKWDMQIADVSQMYPINDLDAANIAIGPKYGDCQSMGIGYCATKSNLVCSPREQLTLCGIQQFVDGASLIWGTEMEDRHNHLLPPGERSVRARSHLFSTCLMPTGPDSFDVEYVLQLEIGGRIPTFLTTPVLIETVKMLFAHAKKYFAGGVGSDIANYLLEQQQMAKDLCLFSERKSILLAP